MGWARTAGIVLALAIAASLPAVTAQAQSFYITTSKGVYEEGERVVVAGTVSDADDPRPVLVKVTSGGDECARQNVRPLRDGSFVSRPMNITDCGAGDFKVTAAHADETTSASFAVRGKQEVEDSFELRAIKSTVTEAQDVVNARVREMLDANLAIPERAAEAYSKGAAEASLTLQGVERGDVEFAGEHREQALAYFREALDLLSPDRLGAVTDDVREEQTRVSAANEWLGRLQDLFGKLVNLADKNNLVVDEEFSRIDGFLSDARQLIGENRTDSAEESLKSADQLLEEARKKLIQQAEGGDSQAQSLTSAADRLQSTAQELRGQADGVPRALAKVNASFVLINGARASIEEGDYDAAKASLDSALRILEDAKKILEDRD
ncbi:hypothetical protein [Nitrososphaera sp.]|uniref:hypothetical protein n=1 Tax=Nitrososphaera sp. TaxID=1971748 RepID=UPI0017B1FA5D|nr:hypothetical protein [Nitrososphaera sp.]NWG37916.1 hypothetical protein [Nitrososphaera sp.]